METNLITACPVCGTNSSHAERLLKSSIRAYARELFYSVELCGTCGLLYSAEYSVFHELYTPVNDPEKDHGRHQTSPTPIDPSQITAYTTKKQQALEIVALITEERTGSQVSDLMQGFDFKV
jgi:hypothetical protein